MGTEDKRESEDDPVDDGVLPLDDEEDEQEDDTHMPEDDDTEHETQAADDEAYQIDETPLPETPAVPAAKGPDADRAFRGFLLLAILIVVALAIIAVAWNFHLVWHGKFFPAVISKEEKGLGSTFYRLSTIQERIEENPNAAYGYPKGIVLFLKESGLIADLPASRPASEDGDENPPDGLDSETE